MLTNGFDIFKRALSAVRHNRFLWPFAFFIALAGGGSQGYSLLLQSPIPRGMTGFSPIHRIGEKISSYAHTHFVFTVLMFIGLGIVGLVVLAIGILAQASAIGGVAETEAHRPCTWRDALWWGRASFLRFLAVVVAYLVLVGALSLPSILYWNALKGTKQFVLPCLGGLVLGLAFLLASVLGGIIVELAGRFIVLEGAGIVDGVRDAFTLFRDYWREVLLAWVYVLGISIAGTLAMAILLGILATPLVTLFNVSYRHQNPLLISFSIVVFLLAWALASALVGVFAITGSSVWTITFLEIEPVALPRSVRPGPGGGSYNVR